VRRAVSVLALPLHARQAAGCTLRTVDAIWHAAGDRTADFTWYTKRAMLAAVYGATLLYWLRDASEDNVATLGFLDRRLAGIGRTYKLRSRASAVLRRVMPPLRRPA
jgi:ubiquinone biosynthesis protein COQ9